ncbi:MAG: hypothetical protein HKO77_00180 [Gemmatimonadetes bacterium]|nr:hypothetical protein [Gemmatimonadota bacterium]
MFRFRAAFTTILLAGSAALVGCSSGPTTPSENFQTLNEVQDSIPGTPTSGTPTQAMVAERSQPLPQDEVASQVIGPLGGVIQLPEAGLTVVFPIGAVDSPTEITVTAPAGNLVGYHFAPHGLEFNLPVAVMQDLTKATIEDGADLSAVYFDGDLEPEVTVLEELTLELLDLLGIFEIDHFSGYVIATN